MTKSKKHLLILYFCFLLEYFRISTLNVAEIYKANFVKIVKLSFARLVFTCNIITIFYVNGQRILLIFFSFVAAFISLDIISS